MKYPDDFINKIICGDSLKIMKQIPAKSIDMVITSPPYWGLRDYGIGPNQLGLEPTPEIYIEHLTEIFNEAKRILKKEGTLWLNIGDTYGGSGQGSQTGHADYKRKKIKGTMQKSITTKFMPKCLSMIPERLAWSLIQNGWILRNKIIWFKPNSMPSSVTDRFSNRWEYIFLFSKNKKYYFDLDAIREAHLPQSITRLKGHDYSSGPWAVPGGVNGEHGRLHELGKNLGDVIKLKQDNVPSKNKNLYKGFNKRWNERKRKGLNIPGQNPQGIHRKRHSGYYGANGEFLVNPMGKNPGDVFEITTQPFPEAHFAVFPEKLCEKPIKAGCPERVCKKCGKARERIIEQGEKIISALDGRKGKPHGKTIASKEKGYGDMKGIYGSSFPKYETKTIGWTSCKCNAGFEGGIVLDPFCGSGTALFVAKEMKRCFIGIDIKEEYCEMARNRTAQGVL